MTRNHSASDEAPIRELLAERVRAIHAKDVDAMVAQYDPASVIYNLAPPLQTRGADPEAIRTWFGGYDGPIRCEIAHEQIAVGGDVAFCNFLYRTSGTHDGKESKMWVRATLGLRRREEGWKIVHEHDSDPFDMKTFKALLDLEP